MLVENDLPETVPLVSAWINPVYLFETLIRYDYTNSIEQSLTL